MLVNMTCDDGRAAIVNTKMAFGCCHGQNIFAFAYTIKPLASGCIAHGNTLGAVGAHHAYQEQLA